MQIAQSTLSPAIDKLFTSRFVFPPVSLKTRHMASYDQYDKRLESLVVETRTWFAADVSGLSDDDKAVIARAIHEQPQLASKINYERAHTGFTREITVTAADIARLYDTKVSGGVPTGSATGQG